MKTKNSNLPVVIFLDEYLRYIGPYQDTVSMEVSVMYGKVMQGDLSRKEFDSMYPNLQLKFVELPLSVGLYKNGH